MRLCGLTKHSTQVFRCRCLGTVTLLIMVPGTPCCLPSCIQPQTVPTCRLGWEGLCSVVSLPPSGCPTTSWNLFCLPFSITSILNLAAEAQRGHVVHKGHTGAQEQSPGRWLSGLGFHPPEWIPMALSLPILKFSFKGGHASSVVELPPGERGMTPKSVL